MENSYRNSSLLALDLVDLTRQVLANFAPKVLRKISHAALGKKDLPTFRRETRRFLSLLESLDEILATQEEFLLGGWLGKAADTAAGGHERLIFEWNARNLVTLWGPRGNILDYSARQWSGLVTAYYKVSQAKGHVCVDVTLCTSLPAQVPALLPRAVEMRAPLRLESDGILPLGPAESRNSIHHE